MKMKLKTLIKWLAVCLALLAVFLYFVTLDSRGQFLVIILGLVGFTVYRLSKKLKELFVALKIPQYACLFKMKVIVEPTVGGEKNYEVNLENDFMVLPFVPFVGLIIDDCLNPWNGEDSAEEHDFKEFNSFQPIEKIKWGSFHNRFECYVPSITSPEDKLGSD